MTTYRKKLIEVALPLKAINEASAREKSIRHGHPSTLHLWWARRPLAACRAVLFSSLVYDPDSDPAYLNRDGSVDEERAGTKRAELFNLIEELVQWGNSNNEEVIRSARAEIARCVASQLIEAGKLKKNAPIGHGVTAGELVSKGHCMPIPAGIDKKLGRVRFRFQTLGLPNHEAVNQFLAEFAPPVLDPFCGGGSIPLEAQRLGLRAYGSDLNPVPVLITKALVEIPPKFSGQPPANPVWHNKSLQEQSARTWKGAEGLADDVRYYGKWMREEAKKRIGKLYPKVKITPEMAKGRPDLEACVGEQLTVIAWLWARTVVSPNPAAGRVHVPLVSSFVLSSKGSHKSWVEIVSDDNAVGGWRFRVQTGELSKEEEAKAKLGTKSAKAKDFTCAVTQEPIPRSYIQSEGKSERFGVRMMAIVCEGARGRHFVSPTAEIESVALNCASLPEVEESRQSFLNAPIPTRAMITGGVCSAYGLRTYGHLYTSRQLSALTTFCNLVAEAREEVLRDVAQVRSGMETDSIPASVRIAYADAVATYLAFSVSRQANRLCTMCFWDQTRENVQQAFGRQAFAMTWDFCEANPFSDSTGNWIGQLEYPAKCIDAAPAGNVGTATQIDATAAIINVDRPMISTDPPYYDNISYAVLSDFFYVWLRQSLRSIYSSLFATTLTPKTQELIASPYRHDGDKRRAQEFFESGLGHAFAQMHEAHSREYPFTVFYAFKQSETTVSDNKNGVDEDTTASTGWETMLAGLVRSGFAITGTWPMRTELVGNLKRNIAALASSIVLVCRSRPADAPLATRKEFLVALRRELPAALKNLQHGNIAPVDLAQAAIGPGMAVFTRYAKVVEADGHQMVVRTALGIINQVLDEVLSEQESEFDADTRWALAWFEQYGTSEGPYGIAETLSNAKNTSAHGLVEAGIINNASGRVKLVCRKELPSNWDPTTDSRFTAWEATQQLIHTLESQGEAGAAALVNKLGGFAETARELAYRLYSVCERNKWTEEALAYNGLVIAWPELTKLALAARNRKPSESQQQMF